MTTLSGIVLGGTGGPVVAGSVAVPPVGGRSRTDAEKELKRFGFRAVVEEVEAGGTEDEVYAQDPMPPATRPRGSVVRLFVIRNPVAAPDFTARLDSLDAAVQGLDTAVKSVATVLTALDGKVETDAAAGGRQRDVLLKLQEVSDKLDQISGSSRTGQTPPAKS